MSTSIGGGATTNLDALAVAGATTLSGAVTASGAVSMTSGPTIGYAQMATPSGTAPIYGARAWCVFDGTVTGTNAPLAGGNVTNIQRTAAGRYLITFATAMPDANYSAAMSARYVSAGGANLSGVVAELGAFFGTPVRTTTQLAILVTDSSAGAVDSPFISVAIFR